VAPGTVASALTPDVFFDAATVRGGLQPPNGKFIEMKSINLRRRIVAGAALLLLAVAGTAFAQLQTGNLYGTVVDDQGAALAGVKVTLTGVGASKIQVTNDQGQFRFLGLAPGRYTLKAEKEGFLTQDYPNIAINVGRNTTIEVTLSAAVEDGITVTAAGRCIEFGSAFSTDINLRIYEAGYLDHPDYDLVVTEVSQVDEAIRLLAMLEIRYVVPEVSNGTTWRIPKVYSHQQLRAKLSRLPCRLNVGYLYFKWQVLEHMKSSAAFRFSLVPNDGGRNEV
jgi:hypothetical protein